MFVYYKLERVISNLPLLRLHMREGKIQQFYNNNNFEYKAKE